MSELTSSIRVLITGASGYIGRVLVQALAKAQDQYGLIVATSRREPKNPLSGIVYETLDIRDRERLFHLCAVHKINRIVHLAAVVTPKDGDDRQVQYETDIGGMHHILDACEAFSIEQLVYTSSGAAYGYSPLNPIPLTEEDTLRGNQAFAYSWHKKEIEEILAAHRAKNPQTKQVIFRVCAVLGEGTKNQITDLFERPVVTGVIGYSTPFTFIWDEDVSACLKQALDQNAEGIFNMAGDGALPLKEIAQRLGRRFLPLPAGLIRGVIFMLNKLGKTKLGPEQVIYLQYRPVMDNRRLKEEFGFTPRSSAEVFEHYARSRD